MANLMASGKTEALRGKERLQQLIEEFPEAKPRQVVSTDLAKEGIKPNESTRQLGKWALPDAPGYFEYNRDEAHRAAERSEMGYYLSPAGGYFGDGASLAMSFDSRSPYEVRYEERGRYRLYRDGEALEEVFFIPRPQWYDRKTSSGKPMASVLSQTSEGSLKLAALTYCEYGKDDLTCRYCNINAAETVVKETGLVRQVAKREQDVYETVLAACQERTQRSMVLSGGVILDPSKEADMYARLVKVVRRAMMDAGQAVPIEEVPIMVVCQAMEPEDQMKLREAGASNLKHNLEVWDPRLFGILCPGKSKYVGRERWLERLVHAVEIFGRGNVGATLIQGLEMLEPYGFKAEDEGAGSYLEGCEWLLEHGVIPLGYPMRGAPGTEFAGRQQGRIEYHLRLQLARNALCTKHGMPIAPSYYRRT